MPMTMKANSPPWPSSSPPSAERPHDSPNTLSSTKMINAFIASRPTTDRGIHNGSASSARRSMPMPTDMKNRPISRPLKGSMVISTSWRNSVSAMIRPASSAPRAIDRPAYQVSAATPRVVSRVSAVKVSGCFSTVIWWNSGRTTRRPIR